MTEQEFTELAAGFALAALSPEDDAAFRSALTEHPEWRASVAADLAAAAALAEALPEAEPPASVRAALLDKVAALPARGRDAAPAAVTTDTGTVPPVTRALRLRWGVRAWFALAASIALIFGLGFGGATLGQWLNRPPEVVALEQIRNAEDGQNASVDLAEGGQATAYWSASIGQAVLVTEGLPPIAADQTFELWLVRPGGVASAGLFTSASGDATALLQIPFDVGDAIAVSVEPAGGSPTGEPTSDPLAVIPTA